MLRSWLRNRHVREGRAAACPIGFAVLGSGVSVGPQVNASRSADVACALSASDPVPSPVDCLSRAVANMGVSKGPNASAFTRMPLRAWSSAA